MVERTDLGRWVVETATRQIRDAEDGMAGLTEQELQRLVQILTVSSARYRRVR
jgi:hypothetical protein